LIRENKQLTVICYFLLCLLLFSLYIPTLHFDFVWDDYSFLVSNDSLRSWSSIINSFFDANTFAPTIDAQIYRPLRNIIWILELKVFGLDQFYFHYINLLIHISITVLLFYFLHNCYGIHKIISFLSALFFGLHPLNTEIVCWIKSVDDLLAALSAILSLIFLYKFINKSNKYYLFLSFFSFACALFAKESSSFLIIVILIILNSSKLENKRKIITLLAYLFILAIYAYMRYNALHQLGQVPYIGGGFFRTQLGMSNIYINYFSKIICPVFQRVNYMGYSPFTDNSYSSLFLLWGLLLVVFSILFKILKNVRLELAAFLLSFIPVSNLIPMMQWQAERFLYFPLLFSSIIIAKIGDIIYSDKKNATYSKRRSNLIIFSVVFIIYLSCLFVKTYNREQIWENDRSLGFSMLQSNPNSYHGLLLNLQYNKIHHLYRDNIILGEAYLKVYPNEEFIYENLIYAYLKQKKIDKAIIVLKKGMKIFPDSTSLNIYKKNLLKHNIDL